MNPEKQVPQQQLSPTPAPVNPNPSPVVVPAQQAEQPQQFQQSQVPPLQPASRQNDEILVTKFKNAGRSAFVFGIVLGILLLISILSLKSIVKGYDIDVITYALIAIEAAVLVGISTVGAKLKKTTEFQTGSNRLTRLIVLSGVLLAMTLPRFSPITVLSLVLFIYLIVTKLSLKKLHI